MIDDLVLVTGASGFAAGHCISKLLDRGYRVRGTLRSLSRADEVRAWLSRARGGRDAGDALSFVEAELSDASGWPGAMEGVRYVLHVASPMPAKAPKDPDELIAPAREGTLNVMRAAANAAVERVVQTSSSFAIVYGHGNGSERVFTESDWTDLASAEAGAYIRSKTIAEKVAWETLPTLSRKLEWVSICPGLMLGPVMDRDTSPTIQIIAKMLRGEFPGIPRMGWGVVDVRDIADLHLRAMLAPQAEGERYIGSGPFISLEQIAGMLKAGLGDRARKVPTRKLPDWMVRLTGLLDAEVKGQLVDLGKVRKLSSAKALSQLGWSSRPADQTIVETGLSLIEIGVI